MCIQRQYERLSKPTGYSSSWHPTTASGSTEYSRVIRRQSFWMLSFRVSSKSTPLQLWHFCLGAMVHQNQRECQYSTCRNRHLSNMLALGNENNRIYQWKIVTTAKMCWGGGVTDRLLQVIAYFGRHVEKHSFTKTRLWLRIWDIWQ